MEILPGKLDNLVRPWFGRAKPPTSVVRPIRHPIVEATPRGRHLSSDFRVRVQHEVSGEHGSSTEKRRLLLARSVPSVASLLRRGLEELRNRLKTKGVTRDSLALLDVKRCAVREFCDLVNRSFAKISVDTLSSRAKGSRLCHV